MKSEKSSPKKTVKTRRDSSTNSAAKPPGAVKAASASDEAAPVAKAPAAAPKKRATARKQPLPIPAILLEGDRPAAPAASGPGERYALGPVPPKQELGGADVGGELPEAYGTGRLQLTARDPHWLYVRWDLTQDQQRKYNLESVDRHLVIRLFTDELKGQPLSQTHVHPESTHWFVHVDGAGTKYVAELGYYAAGGKWNSISTSGATLTPPDNLSEDISAQFATIPIEVPFARLVELAREAVRTDVPLAEVLLQLQAHGHDVSRIAEGKWTPEQESALASIISMDRVRRVWMGSLEITELIRRRMQLELSSFGLGISSPIGAISSFSSVSSPFGARERQKGFWFNVNAELILYGATEPDAQVTIGGRPIKLRPDGTFSFRFALPDGDYELPALAISADKTDGRAAELTFGRSTEYRGEVGTHPQDPKLKPPLAANVA